VEAILLDGIDTIAAWRVEIERLIMNLVPKWLQEEAWEEVVGGSVVE
jgi:hypothetical protein